MSKEKAAPSVDPHSGRRLPDMPLSPHLQIWRWHVTMAGSILHRASGVGLYAGAALIVAWLVCVAAGPECYAFCVSLLSSPLGMLIWAALSAGAFYHLFSGVRHLVWDLGYGLEPRRASALTSWSIVLAVLATAAFWIWLFSTGKVTL